MLYGWLIEEQMSVRQILKRLNAGPWLPRSGSSRWSASVVHHILSDPTYSGTAYANRYHYYVPPERPRARGRRSGENTCQRPARRGHLRREAGHLAAPDRAHYCWRGHLLRYATSSPW